MPRLLKRSLCLPCKQSLPWVESLCPGCGRSSPKNQLCALCQKAPCHWDRAHAPLLYLPPLAGMVLQLKFSRQFHYARTLANLFIETLPEGPLPDLILPVPLHPWRLLRRGYNQSTELAKILSERLGIAYSPYCLKRIKYTPPQSESKKSARKSNMKDAFALKRPIKAQHIALVDDVLTTGETLSALCQTIRRVHPDIKIDIWTVAQTPHKPLTPD